MVGMKRRRSRESESVAEARKALSDATAGLFTPEGIASALSAAAVFFAEADAPAEEADCYMRLGMATVKLVFSKGTGLANADYPIVDDAKRKLAKALEVCSLSATARLRTRHDHCCVVFRAFLRCCCHILQRSVGSVPLAQALPTEPLLMFSCTYCACTCGCSCIGRLARCKARALCWCSWAWPRTFRAGNRRHSMRTRPVFEC